MGLPPTPAGWFWMVLEGESHAIASFLNQVQACDRDRLRDWVFDPRGPRNDSPGTFPETPLNVLFIYLFLEGWGGRERNINWLPLTCAPTRDQDHNPDMCPDQEVNR